MIPGAATSVASVAVLSFYLKPSIGGGRTAQFGRLRWLIETSRSHLKSTPTVSSLQVINPLLLCISSPPILSSPLEGKLLFLYLVVLKVVVSAMLFREDDGKQRPVFYTNRMLLDAETGYNVIEKLVLAILNAKKNLRSYFEFYSIVVYTDYPIN